MITLDYSLSAAKNGGKISAFSYSHSLSDLAGSWSATVAGGSFKAGNSISFGDVMSHGIILKAYKNADGLWLLEGKDAGIKLSRSTPNISELPKGSAKDVISFLAEFCDIALVMNSKGLDSFNVRSIISGSTCAEAVLELSMVSGLIAFIDNHGRLNIKAPDNRASPPSFTNTIDVSGSDIDLDSYATQVFITLNRRKLNDDNDETDDNNNSDSEQENIHYVGTTPSTSPERKNFSGTFSNGSYSITTLEPFGVTEFTETSFTENGVTVKTKEEHEYDYKHKVIWRDNQEYVLFAFIEKSYTLTKTTSGTYDGNTFKETTTETLNRTFSTYDAIGVPEDWEGQIDMVSSETITRSTTREGGRTPKENMPAYSPSFDSKINRTFSRENFGRGLLCKEIETTYEARQVGSIAPVKKNGELIPHFFNNSNLAIQTHSTPQWVEVNTYRTYYEQFNDDGSCALSTRSEYSDEGSKWLIDNAMTDTGDEELNDYEKSYAKFSQSSKGLEVSLSSTGVFPAWQFVELRGRMKSESDHNDEKGTALGNISEWYYNGDYIYTSLCPHYNSTNAQCNVYSLAYTDSAKYEKGCLHIHKGRTNGWLYCARAVEALKLARKQDKPLLDNAIFGSASLDGAAASFGGDNHNIPKVGYEREFYVDDILDDETAQEIADNIAANILKVKGNKGIRKTVTIPYNPDYLPNGCIVEVSHDWASLQSSITYLDTGIIPDFLISQSVASIAAFVAKRENSRRISSKYASVASVSGKKITVKIGNSSITCYSKLKNLAEGDIVLVSFPNANSLHGQVIARL